MKKILLTLMLTVSVINAATETSVKQAQFFNNNFLLLCVQHILKIDELRNKLSNTPKLPADKTKSFGMSLPVDIFPIPSQTGNFVLAVAKEKNLCGLLGRRGDEETARKAFIDFFEKPPTPLVTTLVEDTVQQHDGFKAKRISYTWGVKGEKRKTMFMLSTTSSDKAPMQLFATASIISD